MNENRPTKSEALGVIISVFEVYGFLSSITMKEEIISQDMYLAL